MHRSPTLDAIDRLKAHSRHLRTGEGQPVHPGRIAEARDILAYTLGHDDHATSTYREIELWHDFATRHSGK
jgi:hypothetical protein